MASSNLLSSRNGLAVSDVVVNSDATQANAIITTDFDDGQYIASIEIHSEDGLSRIEYNADTHSIDGNIDIQATNGYLTLGTTSGPTSLRLNDLQEFANNAAAILGGLPNGGVYYTTVSGDRILKIVND